MYRVEVTVPYVSDGQGMTQTSLELLLFSCQELLVKTNMHYLLYHEQSITITLHALKRDILY